jgi:hypothetical protein
MERAKATRDMVARSIEDHSTDCPNEAALVETVKEAGFIGEEFHVGDEVISSCGSVVGFILSIEGDQALISWLSRGKSVENVNTLTHCDYI